MERSSSVLPKNFYERDPRVVALELLGKVIVRRVNETTLIKCMIVETEAYLGPSDPASRASKHKGGRIVERLKGPAGLTLVYGIYAQWMLNITAHRQGEYGAVLLRACEPLEKTFLLKGRCPSSGPGRLTRFLKVDKSLDGVPVYDPRSPLHVIKFKQEAEIKIARSYRIGVSKDLEEPLRYCVYRSPCLSIKCD